MFYLSLPFDFLLSICCTRFAFSSPCGVTTFCGVLEWLVSSRYLFILGLRETLLGSLHELLLGLYVCISSRLALILLRSTMFQNGIMKTFTFLLFLPLLSPLLFQRGGREGAAGAGGERARRAAKKRGGGEALSGAAVWNTVVFPFLQLWFHFWLSLDMETAFYKCRGFRLLGTALSWPIT